MSLKANCPACAGPLEFKVSTSLVMVCPYCKSVIGRGDRGLESLGKVADLVETGSPLDVGIKGRMLGVPFDLMGRTQFQHPAGGVWDEWYLAFADGRWGWLAEAQGKFYLTFEAPLPPDIPSFESLELGDKIILDNKSSLLVTEKNIGTVASARGEIPERVLPGQKHPFADLSGPSGSFATLDYSGSRPVFYLGREVSLDELKIPNTARRQYPGQEPTIKAVQLSCPNCGGQLELRAPDRSERVGCPYCGSLLDVNLGQLRLLKSLEPPKVHLAIPLGAVGERDGVKWTLIGFMKRYVTVEGVDYFWEEYLLYQPRLGFRWLTCSDDHWNWVDPLPPGAVQDQGSMAGYQGQWFQLFQKAKAKVAYVIGEFYWKVEAGETVMGKDFIRPPYMLSEEVTKDGDQGEINWSFATYLPTTEVERMFGLQYHLPLPQGIGPNQPFVHGGVYKTFFWLIAAAVLLAIFFWARSPQEKVFQQSYSLNALPAEQRSQKVIVDQVLSLKGNENIRVLLTPQSGQWVYIDGTLTPATGPPAPGTALTAGPKSTASRRFAFVSSGTSTGWVYLSSLPPGEYHLQFDVAWRNPQQPVTFELRLEQGVAHPFLFGVIVLLLISVPVVVGLYQMYFESARWAESNLHG